MSSIARSEFTAAAPGDPRIGARVGDFSIEAAIAEGGVARIYRGRHVSSGEEVAVKVLRDEAAQEPVAVERFRREFETAFGLVHPYIVKAREFGRAEDGSDFMIMDLLDGEPLSALLAREGALEPERALRFICQIAVALEHAHSFGVIHRDLKPENIFLSASDDGAKVQLLDFGSVKLQLETSPKLTAYGMTLGSPSYMAPEQAEGFGDIDPRTDVFALAAVAYEMFTGAVAFDGPDAGAVLTKILQGRPVPTRERDPSLPLGIDVVISAGLMRDKSRRTGTSRELAGALLRVFGLEPDVERHASLPLTAWPRLRPASLPEPARPAGGAGAARGEGRGALRLGPWALMALGGAAIASAALAYLLI